MQLVFAGTPEFAAVALSALLEAGHDVRCVLTQPDRPAGRGLRLQPSPVKQLAQQRGLTLLQPAGLKLDGRQAADAAAVRELLQRSNPEVIVVAAYGLILPAWLLELPRRGCLNIHASLLPRWRGAAPIQRAIEAGDRETGITIMQMDAGLDTGDMLLQARTPIAADETGATLHDKLAALGACSIVEALHRLAHDELPATRQSADGATYARKIDKSEAAIDWRDDAAAIERRLRAFDPFPGATFVLGAQTFKAWRGRVRPASGAAPGEVVSTLPGPLVVACGEGSLELTEIQRPGGRRLDAARCLAGCAPARGSRLVMPRPD